MDDSTSNKIIHIVGTNTRYQIKRVSQDKIIKTRNKIKDWNINIGDIDNPLQIMEDLANNTNNEFGYIFKSEITNKINGYKNQDILKKIIDPNQFITLNDVIIKLNDCRLKCFYCKEMVFVLYSLVREKKQWTLDRINNDIGHNKDNVIIACLDCNIQRKRKSKEAFTFTKQFILTRDEHESNIK